MEFMVPLATLIILEIILGIDNVIFISILADKLPTEQRDKLRYWGLGLAMVMRLILLFFISWILQLDNTLFTFLNINFSGKSLILIAGGLFLLFKATKEIYHQTEIKDEDSPLHSQAKTFNKLLMEVILLDIVFSVDSIITAVGMVEELWVMYTAVIITVIIMLIASKPISDFIKQHASFKILALCFLMMIGVSLLGEGLQFHIPKGYIYFAMFFSFLVDVIQMRADKKKNADKIN